MANRRNYYFRQFVSESELDAGFDGLEQADFNLAVDSDVAAVALSTTKGGILDGLTITNSGLLDAIVATGFCYDSSGRRINLPSDTTVVLSATGSTEIGLGGVPTGGSSTVPSSGSRRWVSLFLAFDRKLSDVREDGSGATIYFKSDESFYFYVAMGSQAVNPTNLPDLESDKILLGDFRVTYNGGAGGIDAISYDRRQVWLKAVDSGSTPTTRTDTVAGGGIPNTDFPVRGFDEQDGIRETLKKLLGYYNDHVRTDGKSTDQHSVSSITFSPYKWLTSTNVQAVIQEFVDDLESQLVAGDGPGAGHIGDVAIPSSLDASYDIAADTLEIQLAAIQSRIDTYCLDLSGFAGIQTVANGIIVNLDAALAGNPAIAGNGCAATGNDESFGVYGVGASTVDGESVGVMGESGTPSGSGLGYGVAGSGFTAGIYGEGTAKTGGSLSIGIKAQGGTVVNGISYGVYATGGIPSGAGIAIGVFGDAGVSIANSSGVYGLGPIGVKGTGNLLSGSAESVGVYGTGGLTVNGNSVGVKATAANPSGGGIPYGFYTDLSAVAGGIGLYAIGGNSGFGVFAYTAPSQSYGIAIETYGGDTASISSIAIRAGGGTSSGASYGGKFTGGSATNKSYGIYSEGGISSSDNSYGVYGLGGTANDYSFGIYGKSTKADITYGVGVYGEGGTGVEGISNLTTGPGGRFQGGSNAAPLNLVPRSGTPGSKNNGDMWIDSGETTTALRFRIGNVDYKVTATTI